LNLPTYLAVTSSERSCRWYLLQEITAEEEQGQRIP